MRISFSLLLSAFLATVKGQTFTFDFPPTGTGIGGPDAHQVCVKGAKWADLITTNDQSEESRYDISSTDFRNGDKMDANWAGRYAVNIPEGFECKGGILFQHDKMKPHTSLDLTLKATLADGETKLTVCAFYTFFYQHSPSPNWSDTLPALGFTKSLRLFQKATSGYNQYYNPETVPYYNQINTLCRSFDSVIDSEYFDEAEPLPATVSYTFPEVGETRILSGICIKGAQFASATNSVADYPELRMSTRKFERFDNIWWDNFWFETNRNIGSGMPMRDWKWSALRTRWTAGNPCEGALYLQPQHLDIVGFYYEEPRFKTHSRITTEADMERFGKNQYTVDIMPVANESSVQICALISRSYWYTSSWLKVLGDYGFTTNGPNKDINGFSIFCKDIDVPPPTKSPTKPPTISPTFSPTNPPTNAPTNAPTMIPTSRPTTEPTSEPTSGIEETKICPSDVRLRDIDGVTSYPPNDLYSTPAVSIVSQDVSAVTVALNQAWKTPSIEKYFYAFKPDRFNLKCFETDNVETEAVIDTITIQCNIMSPVAYLNICLQDSTGSFLDSSDNGMVGKCCHSDAPEGTPTVCYRLEISCEPKCLEEASRARNLRAL